MVRTSRPRRAAGPRSTPTPVATTPGSGHRGHGATPQPPRRPRTARRRAQAALRPPGGRTAPSGGRSTGARGRRAVTWRQAERRARQVGWHCSRVTGVPIRERFGRLGYEPGSEMRPRSRIAAIRRWGSTSERHHGTRGVAEVVHLRRRTSHAWPPCADARNPCAPARSRRDAPGSDGARMSEPQPMPAATLRRLMAAEDPAAVREQRLNEANTEARCSAWPSSGSGSVDARSRPDLAACVLVPLSVPLCRWIPVVQTDTGGRAVRTNRVSAHGSRATLDH